jgi:drug/metabolite transporter (DMT)-like permease
MRQPEPHQPVEARRFHTVSLLKLCIALLAISCAPIFIRFSETDLGANGTVLGRFLVFALTFGPAHLIGTQFSKPQKPLVSAAPMTRQTWLLLIGVGVISIFSLVLWAVSLQYISVAKSMLLNNLTPIFTTLGGWLWFKRKFDSKFLVGMAIAITGAIILSLEDLNGLTDSLLGDFCALLSAVFLGTYFLMVEQLRNQISATVILLSRAIVGSLVLLPVAWFTEGKVVPTTGTALLAVLGLGMVCEGFGQRLLADTMDELSSSFISLFLLLEPIISAILAWLVFAEDLSPYTWVGFAVVLTGIYLSMTSPATIKGAATVPAAAIDKSYGVGLEIKSGTAK